MEATGLHQGQKCFPAHRVLNHPTAHCPERLCDFPFSKMSDSSPLTIRKYGSLHLQWQGKTNFNIQHSVGVELASDFDPVLVFINQWIPLWQQMLFIHTAIYLHCHIDVRH